MKHCLRLIDITAEQKWVLRAAKQTRSQASLPSKNQKIRWLLSATYRFLKIAKRSFHEHASVLSPHANQYDEASKQTGTSAVHVFC